MESMNRKVIIGIVSCIMAMGLQAETVRVMRFVPVAGEESEVALDNLQKVVFTRDSIVLISAKDGEATPMYKYDYRSILFAESSPQEIEEVRSETTNVVRSEKFIKDGQLFIRREGKEYNVMGFEVR
jgi:hypothetical protein